MNRLHLEFIGWLGDSLLETFPVFVVTRALGDALTSSRLSGFTLTGSEVSFPDQFVDLYGDRDLPEFFWLRVAGQAGVDDFGLSNDHRLVISLRALDLIKSHSLAHADILGWSAQQLEMDTTPAQFGFSVADGESVDVSFIDGDLILRFKDWHDQVVEYRFIEALAFRWAARSTVPTPRDDESFEVLSSTWLREECQLEGCSADQFVHHVLCFNASKVLEVISRRRGF